MLLVYHEELPTGYLLAVASCHGHSAEAELPTFLRRVCRSNKQFIWMDCRLLETQPAQTIRQLWALHLRLWRRGGQLVLCRVSQALAQGLQLAEVAAAPGLCIVPTLDDAIEYTALSA